MNSGAISPTLPPPQAQSQVAVVIPTILRPCLETALRSVYAQEGVDRVQIMIGVDRPDDPAALYRVLEARPANVSAQVTDLDKRGKQERKRHQATAARADAVQIYICYATMQPRDEAI